MRRAARRRPARRRNALLEGLGDVDENLARGKNILARLNRELDADFDLAAFAHRVRWNQPCSRIEMHLESLIEQTVTVADKRIRFVAGETIHTENSYKFTEPRLRDLLTSSGFAIDTVHQDPAHLFAVTLATAVSKESRK